MADLDDSAGTGVPSPMDLKVAEKDRAMVRELVKKYPRRWAGVTEQVKARVVGELVNALDEVPAIDDPCKRADIRCSVARTVAMIEGQQQADEHLALKNERLDAGKPTDGVAIQPIVYRGVEEKDL